MSMSIGAVASGGAAGLDLSMMSANLASRAKNQLDTNKDGKVDQAEFVAGLAAKGVSKSGALKPHRVAPPPGGAGPAGGATSVQTYAAADTDKDGLVSAKEELIYHYSHSTHRSFASAFSTTLGHNIDATA